MQCKFSEFDRIYVYLQENPVKWKCMTFDLSVSPLNQKIQDTTVNPELQTQEITENNTQAYLLFVSHRKSTATGDIRLQVHI